MEFKGTKGEWKYEITGRKQRRITVQIPETKYESKTELILGYLDADDDCGNPECCKVTEHANAKLIAAAPELLEALQELMRTYNEKGQLLSFNVDIARQAIKKALE